jgi:ABC-type lipoprotein release transport system permease subunit
VAIASLVAWPVAFYGMREWLQDFAYRIDMGPVTFVAGGMLTLAVVLLTVSIQAVKAALANPVDALRYE